ncbi:MAG: NUDIX hydrolase [Bacteroidota bacterium]
MSFTYDYPRAAVTVDALVFFKQESSWSVLLIKRKNYPFEGLWAIPGGFMDMDETLIDAAHRELEEETGLGNVALSQFYTFDAIGRDPRHRTISTIFVGFTNENNCKIKANDDAADAQWFDINALPEMAFDHKMIIEKAVEWYL